MHLIQKVSWKNIYKEWEENEKGIWNQLYTEQGFKNWKDWRENSFGDKNLKTYSWGLYKISPQDISGFVVASLHGWKQAAKEVESRIVKDIIHAPVLQDYIKLKELKKNFQKEVFLIGLYKEGQIELIDGHHRASILAQMLYNKEKIETSCFLYLGK
jgi:hypothetical protein